MASRSYLEEYVPFRGKNSKEMLHISSVNFLISDVNDGIESTFRKFTGIPNCRKQVYDRRLLFTGALTG